MIDITELAQSLKAAAEKAGANYWQAKKISGDFYVIRKGSYKLEYGYRTYQPIAEIDDKPTRDYVAIASHANVLALIESLEKAQQRITQLESRTVKLPDGWQFEECEIEGCENGAIFSVGTGSRNIHLCDKCAHEPKNSRLKKSPLSKRMPFKMSAGIKVEAE